MSAHGEDVTVLLKAMKDGDASAGKELLPLVYNELHRLAQAYMRRERPDHTLQATALINEAYVRLTRDTAVDYENRGHFIGIAGNVMRRVLVDHARSHKAGIHGGGQKKIQLVEGLVFSDDRSEEVLALDQALNRLENVNPRQAKVVELRFFAGLSVEEVGGILGIAPRTVKLDWALARIWLHKEISGSTP